MTDECAKNLPAIAPDNKSLPGNVPKLELKYFEIILFFATVIVHEVVGGLWLWCLTPLSTIFQLYLGVQFYWWRKPPICKSLANFIT